jgi:hypothetical protein
VANIQKLWTTYVNLGTEGNQTLPSTYVGENGRLWYDNISNVFRVSDGTPGGTIVGGGSGNGGGPGGQNSQVQFNQSGAFGGTSNLVFNYVTNTLQANYFRGDGSNLTNVAAAGNSTWVQYNAGNILAAESNFAYNSITNTLTVDNISSNIISNSANLGNFRITDQTLAGTVNGRDVTIATVGTGNVELLGGFHVHTDGNMANIPQFSAYDGRIDMLVPVPNSYSGAVSIIGSPTSTSVEPQNTGVLLHLTGQQTNPSRIYNDGVSAYGAIINRRYNGTSDAPTGVLANQIVGRVGATPYLLNSSWPSISTTRLDFISTQDQTAANQGSQIQLWATANNANAPVIVGQFDPGTILLTGNLVPNSTTSQYSLGNATNKWGNLYLGPDSLFIEDTTLGTNAELTVDNGALLINGTQKIQIGNMQMTSNGISHTANATSQDLTIGTVGASGYTSILNAGLKFTDGSTQNTAAIPLSQRANAGGVATLGLDGIVPASQLPSGGISYQGTWNASTNTPILSDSTGTSGDQYLVAVGGTQNLGSGSITFSVGDGVLYNGTIWQRVPGLGSGVTSFNTRTGAVTLTSGDVTNALSSGSITNAKLANSNIVVTTGFGLGGGATVDLGGTLTLTANVGNILGGTGVNVSSSSGNFTINIGQPVGTGNSVQFLALSTNTTIQATGNITGGNLVTAGQVVATGNITGGNLKTSSTTINTGITSNGNINFTSSGNISLGAVANLHVTGGSNGQVLSTDGAGNLSFISLTSASANFANYAGNVTVASQPNITSTGTLTSLTVSGTTTLSGNANLTTSPNVSLGSITNVHIAGGTANYVMTTNGNGNLSWTNFGTPGQSIYYGAFYSTTTQTNPVANTANPMTFDTTDFSNGVSIASTSRITFANTGIYNIQFSAQIDKTDAGTDEIDIWLSKNGTNVPSTNTQLTLQTQSAKQVAAWNFYVQATAGDYFQIFWSSPDTGMRLLAVGTQTGPTRPAVPSVILTVNQV